MDDSDLRIRLAAFAFLDEQRRLGADLLARQFLAAGFSFEGQRVPLLGPQGIFKPRLCRLPLSITTVPAREGQDRPYDDALGEDGLLRAGQMRLTGAAGDGLIQGPVAAGLPVALADEDAIRRRRPARTATIDVTGPSPPARGTSRA